MRQLTKHDGTWCVRRLPRELSNMMIREGAKMFVAGGFVRACITGEEINDIDVFVSSTGNAKILAEEYGEAVKAPVENTRNAFTVHSNPPAQFINRWFFEDPAKCLESFDFTVAQAAIWWGPKTVSIKVGEMELNPAEFTIISWQTLCSDTFYEDLAARRLIYTSPKDNTAGGSLLRVLKFYKRGYRIPLPSLGKVVAGLVGEINLKDGMVQTPEGMARVITSRLLEVDPTGAMFYDDEE